MDRNFGEILKQNRESQGLSIRQVSIAIKMTPTMIQDIENENFKNLPQTVFLRGLVRTYLKHLNLNEQESLALFDEVTKYEKPGAKRSPIDTPSNEIRTPTYIWLSRVFIPIFIMGALGIAAVGIMFITKKYDKEIKNVINPEVSAIHKAQDTLPPPIEVASPTQSATPTVSLTETPNAAVKDLPVVNKVSQIITLEPLAKTLVYVQVDDSENQKIILRPDVNRTFQALNKIKLKIQDGGAVNIIHNNKDIGVPGVFGQEIELNFPQQ